MPIALSLLLVLFFLLMNAFFVAAEFSLVRVRKSQVEILVDEGRKGAKYTKLVADNVNAYLSACQLGITLASVSYTHLRAHETGRNLVCRLLLEKKKKKKMQSYA